MSYTILAILDRAETARPVLVVAALAADRLADARIEALHVSHDATEGFMPTEEVMTIKRKQEIEEEAARQSADLRGIFDTWQAEGGLGEWREVTGETAKVIADEAAEADFIVIGHGSDRHQADAKQAIHTALFMSRLTTLLVPAAIPRSLGQNVAIAWKPSDAVNRAVEATLPLLRRAEQVTVLIETDDGDSTPATDDLLGELQKAGITARVDRFQAQGQSIGNALIARAHAAGADLLVMGAYTRRRLAEFIFGGATNEVLAAADLPVLMHH